MWTYHYVASVRMFTYAHRFCFVVNSNDPQNGQCRLDQNLNFTDCTRWNHTSIMDVTTDTELEQISPSISAIGEECVRNVVEAVQLLYRATTDNEDEDEDDIPPPPRRECATNCVLTVRSKTCNTSVLLLEQVYREEAMEYLNDLRNEQDETCVIGLECCDLSQPLQPICTERKYITSNNKMRCAIVIVPL